MKLRPLALAALLTLPLASSCADAPSTEASADPPADPQIPGVFCFRITDIERVDLSDGTAMCAVITPPIPGSIASRKGRSSTESRRVRSEWMTGSSRCESVSVSPCPGKCLPVAIAPCSCTPRTKDAPSTPTAAGSSPKERTLMIGLSGLELTSSTGAKGTWIPTARASRAVIRPIS